SALGFRTQPYHDHTLDPHVIDTLNKRVPGVIPRQRNSIDRLARVPLNQIAARNPKDLLIRFVREELAPEDVTVVEIQLAACRFLTVKRDAQREWIVLMEGRGSSWALPSRDYRSTTDEKRYLMQRGRDDNVPFLGGAAICFVSEVI